MLIQKIASKLVSISKYSIFFGILLIAKDFFAMSGQNNSSRKPFPMKSFSSSDSEVSSNSEERSQNSTIIFSLINSYKKSTHMRFKAKQKSGLKVKQKPGWPY